MCTNVCVLIVHVWRVDKIKDNHTINKRWIESTKLSKRKRKKKHVLYAFKKYIWLVQWLLSTTIIGQTKFLNKVFKF